jgi:hypothetical protein
VSFQPRGPHTSISISFALTVAEITADSFAVTVGLFGISAPSSIMIPLMNKRPTSNFVKVGSLTQRIACRLIARRQAEIQMERPAIPALRDAHGPAGAVIRETGEGRRGMGIKSPTDSGQGGASGGAERVCGRTGGDNVIQFGACVGAPKFAARVWGTCRAAGLAPIAAPAAQGAGPAGLHPSSSAKIHFAFLGVPSHVMGQPRSLATSSTYAIGSPKRAAATSGCTP